MSEANWRTLSNSRPHDDPNGTTDAMATMTSQTRIQANRNNARKSTGPKSARGKSMSRLNALKFGAFTKQALLAGEDPDEHTKLIARLIDDLQPQTIVETMLVDQIASDLWRLCRIEAASRAYLEQIRASVYSRVLRSLSPRALAGVECRYDEQVNAGLAPQDFDNRQGHALADPQLAKLNDPAAILLDAIVSPVEQSPYTALERVRKKLSDCVLSKHAKLCELQSLRSLQDIRRQKFLQQMPLSPPPKIENEDDA